ncbi:MAG: hypothetical protein AUH30_01485 [Candidatus Rokubacteria bacterium 13_1_40CM_68_15]|nr:MAG: hypothetical protein AUH30_01485 [Candidatus Rokubacteria bacterium 13_1_40CM_68_15]
MSRSYAPLTVGRVLVALMFGAYLVGLAPHLVHHLFDHDQAQVDCPFALVAERQHASPVPVIAPLPSPVVTSAVVPTPEPPARDLRCARIDARGPPATA